MKKKQKKINDKKQKIFNILSICLAFLGFVLSVYLIISFITYNPTDISIHSTGTGNDSNWLGCIGSYLSDIFITSFGFTSFLFPLFLSTLSFKLLRHKNISFLKTKTICFIFATFLSCIFLSTKIPFGYYNLIGGVIGVMGLNSIS